MQQMDVWSRDQRWPFEREEKGRVTAGWNEKSPGVKQFFKSAP
jgi:hypothetical protein